MLCLEGTGALSHVSLRHRPDVFNEPCVFAAVCLKGETRGARVLEGPVPSWKRFGLPGSGNGAGGATWGLPRFARARFLARFPFGTVTLEDDDASPEGGDHGLESRSRPGDPDSSSLPVRRARVPAHEPAARDLTGVFSWNARNFMAVEKGEKAVRAIPGGFVLWGGGAEGQAVGRGRLLRADGRPRGPRQPRLVPRRVVRRPDPRLEGRRGRAPATTGRPSPRGRLRPAPPSSCRSPSRPRRARRRSWCSSRGTWGRAACGLGDDPEDDEPGRGAPLPPLVRRRASRGSRRRPSPGDGATTSCARRPPASRTASTTRPSRPRSSRRWRPT